MGTWKLLERLGETGCDHEDVARRALRAAGGIDELIGGLAAREARIKFGAAKTLKIISEQKPEALYPRIGDIMALLDHENKILQWNGIQILGRLAPADRDGILEGMLDRYLAPIAGPVMITAACVMEGAGRIAAAKPHLAGRVARAIMGAEHARYQTDECRNVALGHALDALAGIVPLLEGEREEAAALARRQLKNTRPGTRRKAEKFLKRIKQPVG